MAETAETLHADTANTKERQQALFARAERVFVDGQISSLHANSAPRYVSGGNGAYVSDVDGRTFLDLSGNFGTLIHGHAHPPVVEAVQDQLARGTCFTDPTPAAVELGEVLIQRFGWGRARFTCSGSEAVALAIRLARAVTGKSIIVKFDGAYHGNNEWARVSGEAPVGASGSCTLPDYTSREVPSNVAADVLLLPFNNVARTQEILTRHKNRIAAVLFDPIPSRLGFIPPCTAFLNVVRETVKDLNILMILDDVLNFRLSLTGSKKPFDLSPDIVTLGKLIGGGLPIGAVVGREEIMQVMSRNAAGAGAVTHGDTFTAHALAMVAGRVTLETYQHEQIASLNAAGEMLRERLERIVKKHAVPLVVCGTGSFFRILTQTGRKSGVDPALDPMGTEVLQAMETFFMNNGVIFPVTRAPNLNTAMTTKETDFIVEVFENFLETFDFERIYGVNYA